MNPNDILQLIQNHKWVPLSAVVIFFLVRLTKSDTTFPVNIPPQYRVWAAYVLGLAGAIVQYYGKGGVTWTQAILEGLIASVMASQTHNMVIGSIRGGKEFAFPGLMIPGACPGPGKPPSVPPKKPEATVPAAADKSSEDDITTPVITDPAPAKTEEKP